MSLREHNTCYPRDYFLDPRFRRAVAALWFMGIGKFGHVPWSMSLKMVGDSSHLLVLATFTKLQHKRCVGGLRLVLWLEHVYI